ncbi:aldose epimerase [Cellulomonas sp.]|uniref:aldose epimerase family protein n=1 Tax=Cellulomonas sp. TaxID=40001 RepID=UPI003BA9538C
MLTASTAVTLARVTAGGRTTAAVDLRGGGLRALVVDGVPLVETYPEGAPAPQCAGAVLFPWPNRVRDGRWTQRGVTHQLPVNEPGLGHAGHGLVGGTLFAARARARDRVTVVGSVTAPPGYPFSLTLAVTYELTPRGLTVTSQVCNDSPVPAPVALGAHPYLRIGDVPTEDLVLRVPADTHLPLDERLIPRDAAGVDGTAFDLRRGRRLGTDDLHACFAVTPGSSTTVTAPDGRALELWADDDFAYRQVYVSRAYPAPGDESSRRALAVEPMTAPGDALNSGTGLRWVPPGGRWRLAWGIKASLG